MSLELFSCLHSHLDDVIFASLNAFFSKAIHWWNAVPNDILTLATFKDDLYLSMGKSCG